MSATTVTVAIDSRGAAELLAAARGVAGARAAIHRAAADAVAVQVRGWFISRNAGRSRHASSNYWSHAAEAIHTEADALSGAVIVRHPGVAWHYRGGTIHARPGKALAIPLRDEVYGVWPSEFFKSRRDAFVWRKGDKAFLAAAPGKGARRGNRTLRLLYILLKSVSKDADPTVLPPLDAQTAAASDAVRELVRLALARRFSGKGST